MPEFRQLVLRLTLPLIVVLIIHGDHVVLVAVTMVIEQPLPLNSLVAPLPVPPDNDIRLGGAEIPEVLSLCAVVVVGVLFEL